MAGYSSRHIEFAHELAKGATIYDAAIKAGFSPTTANKKAHTWVGKSREDSKYPELWDMVQEIWEAAKDEAIDEVEELKEWLRKVWQGGTMDIDLGGEVKMPKAVQEQSRLKAADTYLKLLPAQVQKSEVTVKNAQEEAPDFSNLTIDEKMQLLSLMKKARGKEED